MFQTNTERLSLKSSEVTGDTNCVLDSELSKDMSYSEVEGVTQTCHLQS